MKVVYIIIIFLLSNVLYSNKGDSPRNIVDYYLIIPSEYILDEAKFYLKETNNIYSNRVLNLREGEEKIDKVLSLKRKVIIDKKNGYLNINSVVHDLSGNLTLDIFKDKNKNDFIGIESTFNDYSLSYSKLVFCEFKNSNFIDITDKIFPKVSFTNFLDEAFEIDTITNNTNFNNLFHVVYILPRYGTTISISLLYIDPQYIDMDNDQKELYTSIISKLKYNKIDINWEINKGMFEIGQRHSKENE